MSDSGTFNGSRLGLARRRRGLTKVDLGRLVDLTPRRIAGFENQDEAPPAQTALRLADALRFPVEFFYKAGADLPVPDTVSFRAHSKLTAGRRDASVAACALAAEVADWLEAHFELPSSDVPDLSELSPRGAAVALRTSWRLSTGTAPNMVHLLEAHGVRVFSLVDDIKELDAFATWIDDTPFVFLTTHKSAERGRWDAAHELGHLVLHGGFAPQGKEQEAEADAFASEFLMPEAGFLPTVPRRQMSLQDVLEQKLLWQVSAMGYIRRLDQLGLLTEWQYRNLVVEASRAGYRSREDDIERERSLLFAKVLQAMPEMGASIYTLAAELSIPAEDIRGLMFDLPMIGLQGTSGSTASQREARHLRIAD